MEVNKGFSTHSFLNRIPIPFSSNGMHWGGNLESETESGSESGDVNKSH